MWNLNLPKLRSLVPDLGSVAIETGTCRGNGSRVLSKDFSRVITIELSEEISLKTQQKLSSSQFKNIEFLVGDSAATLPNILHTLKDEESIFIFLDAHWSGDSSVSWEKDGWQGYGIDTAHKGEGRPPTGPQQCPLAEELAIIVKDWRGRAIVLVDDTKNIPFCGPGLKNGTFPGEDWSHLSRESLLSIVNNRLEHFYELDNPEQWLFVLRAKDSL